MTDDLPKAKVAFVVDWADGNRHILDSITAARLVLGLRMVRNKRLSRMRRVIEAASGLYGFELISHRRAQRGRLIVYLRERAVGPVEPDAFDLASRDA